MKKMSFSLFFLPLLFLSCLWEEKHDCDVRILVQSPSPLPTKGYTLFFSTKYSSCMYKLDLDKQEINPVTLGDLPDEIRLHGKGCRIFAHWRQTLDPRYAFIMSFLTDETLGLERPSEMEVELREGSVIHSSHRLVFDYKPSLMWGKYPQEIRCWNAKAPLMLHFP